MEKEIRENIDWIASGAIGCVFAATLVRKADEIGWLFRLEGECETKPETVELDALPYYTIKQTLQVPKGAFILSVVFPGKTVDEVVSAAVGKFGMKAVHIDAFHRGLRIKQGSFVSWVQYFGPDSHVRTRQAPHPMLTFAVRLPAKYHVKVGFNGILHLAHASVHLLSEKAQRMMWERSHQKTEEILGHKPTVAEAAKTTFKKG